MRVLPEAHPPHQAARARTRRRRRHRARRVARNHRPVVVADQTAHPLLRRRLRCRPARGHESLQRPERAALGHPQAVHAHQAAHARIAGHRPRRPARLHPAPVQAHQGARAKVPRHLGRRHPDAPDDPARHAEQPGVVAARDEQVRHRPPVAREQRREWSIEGAEGTPARPAVPERVALTGRAAAVGVEVEVRHQLVAQAGRRRTPHPLGRVRERRRMRRRAGRERLARTGRRRRARTGPPMRRAPLPCPNRPTRPEPAVAAPVAIAAPTGIPLPSRSCRTASSWARVAISISPSSSAS